MALLVMGYSFEEMGFNMHSSAISSFDTWALNVN